MRPTLTALIRATPSPMTSRLAGSGTGVLANDSEICMAPSLGPAKLAITVRDNSPGRSIDTLPSAGATQVSVLIENVPQALKLPVIVAGRTKLAGFEAGVIDTLISPALSNADL